MTSEPASIPETPKAPSRWWKWLRRIGCAFVLLSFTCCGLSCVGGWWLIHLPYNMNKDDVDRFHAEGLHGGDIKAIHDRADPKFRQRFSLEDLKKFLDERPGILERGNIHGVDFKKKTIDGVEYVKIKSKPSWFSTDEWEIVCKVVDGVLVLVGISPGMDDFVPQSFHYRRPSSRRHRWD